MTDQLLEDSTTIKRVGIVIASLLVVTAGLIIAVSLIT